MGTLLDSCQCYYATRPLSSVSQMTASGKRDRSSVSLPSGYGIFCLSKRWKDRQNSSIRFPSTPPHTPLSDVKLLLFSLLRGSINSTWYMLLTGTSLALVVLLESSTLYGKRSPAIVMDVVAVLHLVRYCQIVREDVAIVDICMVVLGPIALFSLHAYTRVVTLTALQTAVVFLSASTTIVRFVRCRQHSRQRPL